MLKKAYDYLNMDRLQHIDMLEAAIINRMIKQNQIPYAHIVTTNSGSIRLQEKLAMSFSDRTIVWLCKN